MAASPRRPIHLGIAVGISASVYAVSLAAVTGLQSAQSAQLATDRAPLADAAARLDASNALLDSRLTAARDAFNASAAAFTNVAGDLGGFERRLRSLAGTVAVIHGSAVSLPAAGAIPRVSSAGGVAAPAVHATTTASGKP